MKVEPYIQFISGIKEYEHPEVKLTRSKAGKTGTATFFFERPSLFYKKLENIEDLITGMYLTDEEGSMFTKDVLITFDKRGKPENILAIYIMQNLKSWDRFMRFMERYRKKYGLVFISGCLNFDE